MPPTIAAQVLTRDVADTNYVHVTGNQTVSGVIQFNNSPAVPTPQNSNDAANKSYVDTANANLLASPAPIGSATPNTGVFSSVNSVVNACAQSGSDFGAKINAAVAACTGSSCQVQLCAGSFTPTDAVTLPSGVHIIGAGEGATNLTWAGTGYLFTSTDAANTSIENITVNLSGSAGAFAKFAGSMTGSSWHHIKRVWVNAASSTSMVPVISFTGTHLANTNLNFLEQVELWEFSGVGIHFDHATDNFLNAVDVFGAVGGTTSQSLILDTEASGTQITDLSGGWSGLHGFVMQNLNNTQSITSSVSTGTNISIPVANSGLCQAGIPGVTLTDNTNFDSPSITSIPDGTHIVVNTLAHSYTSGAKLYCGLPPTWVFAKGLITDCSSGGDNWLFDASLFGAEIGFLASNSWASGGGMNCNGSTVVTGTANNVHIAGGSSIHINGSNIRNAAANGVLIDSTRVMDVRIAESFILGNNQSNGSYDGIHITGHPNDLIISSNHIGNYPEVGGHQNYALNAQSDVEGLIFNGNDCGYNNIGCLNVSSVISTKVSYSDNVAYATTVPTYVPGTLKVNGLATFNDAAVQNLTVNGACTGCGNSSVNLASPPAIGSTTPNAGTFTTLTAQSVNGTANAGPFNWGGDLSVRDIPGHEYFVSKYASIQAAIDAAYNNGAVLGGATVVDDRLAPYSGVGFIVRDSVTVKLAATTYTITGTVSNNNGVAT